MTPSVESHRMPPGPSVIGGTVTANEFRASLRELGMSYAEFARVMSYLSGNRIAPHTIWRYGSGRHPVSSGVAATVRVMEMLPAQKMRRLRRTVDSKMRTPRDDMPNA